MTTPADTSAIDAAFPTGAAQGPDCRQLLYTPADAAELLAVPESWLRRKAGRRLIPCTFVGKHLRFSTADLAAITATGAQPALQPRRLRGHH
jgi:excisionase family DNA binding protein